MKQMFLSTKTVWFVACGFFCVSHFSNGESADAEASGKEKERRSKQQQKQFTQKKMHILCKFCPNNLFAYLVVVNFSSRVHTFKRLNGGGSEARRGWGALADRIPIGCCIKENRREIKLKIYLFTPGHVSNPIQLFFCSVPNFFL